LDEIQKKEQIAKEAEVLRIKMEASAKYYN
jgi:hypothetical protein